MSATARLLLDIDIGQLWKALARAEDALARQDHQVIVSHEAQAGR